MSYKTVNYTAAKFTSLNPILELSEVGTETDTGKFKVGDGSTDWNSLPYGLPPNPSGANTVSSVVDFGSLTPEETLIPITVSVPWVTENTTFVCSVVEGQDHTADEVVAEAVIATVGTVIPGVSFDLSVTSINGSTGKFLVNVVGL